MELKVEQDDAEKTKTILQSIIKKIVEKKIEISGYKEAPIFIDPDSNESFRSSMQRILSEEKGKSILPEGLVAKISKINGRESWSLDDVRKLASLDGQPDKVSILDLNSFYEIHKILKRELEREKITYSEFIDQIDDVGDEVVVKADKNESKDDFTYKLYSFDILIETLRMADYDSDGFVSKGDLVKAISDPKFKGVNASMLVAVFKKIDKFNELHPLVLVPFSKIQGGNRLDLKLFESLLSQNKHDYQFPEILNEVFNKFAAYNDHLAVNNQTLFNSKESFEELFNVDNIGQYNLGDCWLVSSLIATAEVNPSLLYERFTENGDGTITFRPISSILIPLAKPSWKP